MISSEERRHGGRYTVVSEPSGVEGAPNQTTVSERKARKGSVYWLGAGNPSTRGLESSRRTTKVQGRPALGWYRTLGSMTNLALHHAQATMPEKVTETVPSAPRPKSSFPSPPSSPLRPPTSANRGLQSHSGPVAGVMSTPKKGRSNEVENDSASERGAVPSASKGKAGRISLQAPGTPTKSRPRQQEHATGPAASSSRAALHAMTSMHTGSSTRKPAQDPHFKPSEYLGSGIRAENNTPGELPGGVASSTLRRKREAPQTPDTSPQAPPNKKARIVPEQVEEEQEKRPEASSGGALYARETIQTPPGKRHWDNRAEKHNEAQQSEPMREQKKVLSDGTQR